jgi:phosphoribosylanthranilate isomerase
MMQVKICGITTLDDAHMAASAGANMLGFNFYEPSPRYITPDAALAICNTLRRDLDDTCPVLVGVFVNGTVGDVSIITNHVGLDFAQLSGDETIPMLKELRGIAYKAIRPMDKQMALSDVEYFAPEMPDNEQAPSLLLDAYHPNLYGGTGEETSAEVANAVNERVPRLMLAGGLNPDNIAARIEAIRPWGVDVASGVEDDEPGVKSMAKVEAFIEAAKNA